MTERTLDRIQHASDFAKRIGALRRDRRGAVALYAALAGSLILGSLVLAVDVGRMSVLRTQMQNAADAAAVAAASQLDGQTDARDRAEAMARQTATDSSSLAGGDLDVATVEFFSSYAAGAGTAATGDADAQIVRVALAPQDIRTIFGPVIDAISGTESDSTRSMGASAVGTTDPIICNSPPFMICDLTENAAINVDVLAPANAGRQVLLKERGGGGVAPGNYGLLCVDGDCGANAVEDGLADLDDGACTGTNVETSTGSQTNKVRNGINARFDTGTFSPKNPARNVINFPRDSNLAGSTIVGNGNWDRAGYWSAKHGGAALPAELIGATRYQVYLYELGETFGRSNGGTGPLTHYPVDNDLPGGYALIDPPPAAVPVAVRAANRNDNNFDGVPASAPVADPKRRIVVAAILRCQAQNVRGHGEFDTGGRYVNLFLTETVSAPPVADVYAEIVGPFNSDTSPDFHMNARLSE